MSLFLVLLTILVLVLLLLFVLKNELIRALGYSLQALFYTFVILAITSLFVPVIYNSLADVTLRSIGTLDNIHKIESVLYLDKVQDVTSTVGNTINSFLGVDDEENANQNIDGKGPLEKALYPNLISTTAFFYRLFTFIISILSMTLLLYISYSTQSVLEVAKLQHKVDTLESRILKLEKEQNEKGKLL